MKRGTKITVFIASMALTLGSLIGFAGPRHCGGHGMYRHCDKTNNYNHSVWNNCSEIDSARVN
jgi:hypothetical protein